MALPYFENTIAHETWWIWATLAAALTALVLVLYYLLPRAGERMKAVGERMKAVRERMKKAVKRSDVESQSDSE